MAAKWSVQPCGWVCSLNLYVILIWLQTQQQTYTYTSWIADPNLINNREAVLEFLAENLQYIHCVPNKVSPLNNLQQPPQTCTDLNEILHTQDDIYFCHRGQIS